MLVEFVGDLFPESGIIPKDPVKRAQARFFIEGVSSKLFPAYYALQVKNGPVEDLYKALEYLQSLLPAEGFAVGEYSIADIAITPFLARARLTYLNDIGAWPVGEGPKIWKTITTGRFARLAKYTDDLLARESFKATWDEVRLFVQLCSTAHHICDPNRHTFWRDTRSVLSKSASRQTGRLYHT